MCLSDSCLFSFFALYYTHRPRQAEYKGKEFIIMELTKDADKMICCIYKTFLQRRKSGISKSSAKQFSDDYFQSDKQLSSWLPDDLDDTLLEIGRAGLVAVYLGGNFDLTDSGIIYMENRFKNGLNEVIDFISKLIP